MKLLVEVAIFALSLVCVNCYPHGSPGQHCSRDPGHGVMKMAGDNGFGIRVEGDPDTYVPNEVYTVSLTSTQPTTFLGFMLVALQASNDYEHVGTFELIDSGIARFTDNCPDAVTHTSNIPKMSVSFIWTAPPPGVGCVKFKATVVQQKEVWFRDDGALTLTVCEAVENIIPVNFQREIPDCCACGSAKYTVTFVGQWTRYTHPKDYPSGYQNHWSSLTGASHSKDFMPFEYGGWATEGVRRVAEWGSAGPFESEMREEGDNIRTVIKTRPLWPAIGNMSAIVSTDSERHLVSAFSMLGPSPDWCAGVSALDLCTANCGWVKRAEVALFPWDAGTDSGITYLAVNSATTPNEKIAPIISTRPVNDAYPFFDATGAPVKKVATLIVERLDVKGDQCWEDEIAEEVEMKHDDDYNLLFASDNEDSTPPPRRGTMPEKGNGRKPGKNMGRKPDKGMEVTMPPKEGMPPKNMDNVETMMPKKEMMVEPTMPPKQMGGHDTGKQPVDCMTSEWGPWTECTKTCGKHGKQLRSRMIKVRPKNGGRGCGKKKERRSCNRDIKCPSDCKLGKWSQWSDCSQTCGSGGQMRTRPVMKREKHGGAACGETKDMRACPGLPQC
ncbi:spondin-1-like [Glandiceps talaboti]